MRAGGGPALIEADVIRMDSHSSSDDQMKYRTEAEMKELRKRDPLLQTERYLLQNGIYTEEQVAKIRAEIQAEIDNAAEEADAQPQPAVGQHHITCLQRRRSDVCRNGSRLRFRRYDFDDRSHQSRTARRDGTQSENRHVGRRHRRSQGRRVRRDTRVEHAVSRSRPELASGRSQHRRSCRRNGHCRLQADRRNPVRGLCLAGVHADAQ